MGAHPGCYLLSLQLGQGLLLSLAVQVDAFEIGSIVEGEAPMRKDSEVQKGPSAWGLPLPQCPVLFC